MAKEADGITVLVSIVAGTAFQQWRYSVIGDDPDEVSTFHSALHAWSNTTIDAEFILSFLFRAVMELISWCSPIKREEFNLTITQSEGRKPDWRRYFYTEIRLVETLIYVFIKSEETIDACYVYAS